jgi:hypothetical protein
MVRLIVSLLFLVVLANITAQERYIRESSTINSMKEGELNVFQDSRIDQLIQRHVEAKQRISGIPGFRIRIFSQSGQVARQNANQVRAEFLKRYPDMEGYLTYDAPNFKVYVGDFRTRSEALKFHKRVSRDFPNAFIVADRINLPKE